VAICESSSVGVVQIEQFGCKDGWCVSRDIVFVNSCVIVFVK
jgi:hypothetical protein